MRCGREGEARRAETRGKALLTARGSCKRQEVAISRWRWFLGGSGLVFRRERLTAGQIRCAGESACGQSTSGSTYGGRCDSWSGLDRLPGVGVGEKEQVRHCKPGYLEQHEKKRRASAASEYEEGKAGSKHQGGCRASRAARTSQGSRKMDVSLCVSVRYSAQSSPT